MKTKKERYVAARRWIVLVAVLVVGIAVGVLCTLTLQQNRKQAKQEQFSLLADRILQGSNKDRTVNFSNLRAELAEYLAAANLPEDGYSIYFEYLPTGTSIGYNESNTLVGASLLKVPFAIQYYRAVEQGLLSGTDIITLKEEYLDSSYGELYKKGEGYKLTLDELVRTMLLDSDNTALKALADVLAEKVRLNTIDEIFSFVDLNYSSNTEGSTLIGAEAYSSILKCLYFACYISKDDSQQVLSLLTQSKFDNRLKRYIPDEEMPVIAHKIGSFYNNAQSDCGIFYQPKKPYVLCAMVSGEDEVASQHIGKISVIVHEYVSGIDQN